VARYKKERPWELKVTWTLSIVMLLLVFGFFYQSFQEMRKIAPVKVAVERVTGSAVADDATDDSESEPVIEQPR
jgi:hypothetical protein